MKLHSLTCLTIGACLLAGPSGARAQNLVTNPRFTTNLSGWTIADSLVVPTWSSLDANNSAASGSALFTQPGLATGGFIRGLRQCVAVTAGTSYILGVRFRRPSGPGGFISGAAELVWYSTPGCGAFISLSDSSVFISNPPADTWIPGTVQVTAPAGAVSAQFIIEAAASQAVSSFQTYFDDLLIAAVSPVTLTIPASASIHGQNQTFFHSDLWVENRSYSYPIAVTARHRCLTGQTCGSGTKTFTVLPRQTATYGDVIASLFNDPETAGAIELTYDSAFGDLSASTRLYTPSLPNPTYGTAIPAVPPSEARTRSLFVGIGSNGGDLRSGFRTNAGVYHPGASPTSVSFTLYTAAGTVIGSPYTRTWQPNEAFQLNDVFTYVSAGGTVTTNATLIVTTDSPVFSYVTVVDNQSGDSTYAHATPDEALPQ
jgi:hypothetical protein